VNRRRQFRFAILMALACPTMVGAIEWGMDRPSEVLGTANLEPGNIEMGRLGGWSTWDPYVSLRVPGGGIDADRLRWLTVRLYSSAAADLLDVYYKSPDGNWCLGGRFPIRKGWAIYRMDLTKNLWRETSLGADARQWGGPTKRVESFRIDPGNQEGRWIMVDYVKLEPAMSEPGRPMLGEGVIVEPHGTARIVTLECGKDVEAGDPIKVSAEFQVNAPFEITAATGFVRLKRGTTIMRLAERLVPLEHGSAKISVDLPTSAYWYPGSFDVEVGLYELDPEGKVPGKVEGIVFRNSRIGQAKPPVCELRPLGGDPAIFLNGEPLPGMMFCIHGGLHPGYHREFAGTGIHLYSDWFGSSRANDMGHVEPGRYDYSEYDRYFSTILDIDPEAYFLPHIGVTGPGWWQKANPDELCRLEDGTAWPPSFASEKWKKEMGEDFRRLIGYLRKAPYADRIIGILFFNGYTAEWQMWGTWQKSRDDYSAPALGAFRQFVERRHGSDERLRAAWKDPNVTLATAEMPRWEKRRPGGARVLRDPRTERQAMDFYEFISNMDAEALLHFARVAREATGGTALIGTYYAYLTAHGINQQDSGHLAARRVFDSADIDFLMSPPNYWYRKPGEACTFMSATDSLRMRGKLWLDESDHRTHLSDPAAGYGRAANMDETLGVLWREFAEVLTKRAAVSWFDMGGGWFSDPRILDDMRRSLEIMRLHLKDRKAFAPEIGVFVDPESFYWMRPTDANAALDLRQVVTMPQSGAPWDFCLLSDIGDSRMPDYKLYIFLNAFHADAGLRRAIWEKLRKTDATALFVYAPGYFGAGDAPLESMRAFTGIRIAQDEKEGVPLVIINPADPLFASGSPAPMPHGPYGAQNLKVAPLFYADDPDARIAGKLVESNRAGLVVKKVGAVTSIYSAAIQLPPVVIRAIARAAGVHIWLESDDALYADNRFIGIHAASDGEKRIRLPQDRKVFDALSGASVPTDGQTISLKMKRAETSLLRLEER